MGSEYTVIGVPINDTHNVSGRIFVNTLIEVNSYLTLNVIMLYN